MPSEEEYFQAQQWHEVINQKKKHIPWKTYSDGQQQFFSEIWYGNKYLVSAVDQV